MPRNIENIESYLSGDMSKAEMDQFEQDLGSDSELKEKVEKLKLIDSALELAIEEDLRESLKQMANSPKSHNRPLQSARRISFFKFAVAASVLIVIGAGLWSLFGSDTLSIQHFAESSYVDYDYTSLRRGGGVTEENNPNLKLIEEGDIRSATTWYEDLLNDNPNDAEARFILATLYKTQEFYPKARANFLQVAQGNSVLWKEKAEWNYICVSLETGWDKDAQDILNKLIAVEEHSYHVRALELNKLLNQ